jgi:hypothetical protein
LKNQLNREIEKNNRKNRTVKKNPIRIFKKTNRFGFCFIGLKPKNQTKPKLIIEPNKKNRAKQKKLSQTEKTKPIDWVSIFALK